MKVGPRFCGFAKGAHVNKAYSNSNNHTDGDRQPALRWELAHSVVVGAVTVEITRAEGRTGDTLFSSQVLGTAGNKPGKFIREKDMKDAAQAIQEADAWIQEQRAAIGAQSEDQPRGRRR